MIDIPAARWWSSSPSATCICLAGMRDPATSCRSASAARARCARSASREEIDARAWPGSAKSGLTLLNPTGAERLAKLASRGPGQVLDGVLGRVFDR